jgi:glycine cleavage system protein P-like pyridoxal-binding family
MTEQRRRSEDKGWITRAWDWIDDRDIDKHAVSLGIFYGTIRITSWAMAYAHDAIGRSGLEVAAVIAAVLAPYMALQGAALKFYFEART